MSYRNKLYGLFVGIKEEREKIYDTHYRHRSKKKRK